MATVPFIVLSANPIASAVALEALARIAGKEESRDSLPDGASYSFNLAVLGTIDGEHVNESLAGRLTVGHASERQNATVAQDRIIASLLSRLSKTARKAALRDIPALHGAGHVEVAAGDLDDAADLLAACKATAPQKTATVRGTVRCEYARTPVANVA